MLTFPTMHHSNFVHLHLHTQYSLLDGAIRPEALIALAKEYRMPAVAVTDHGNLFGAVEFYQKAMSKGIKPIIGCEVYVAPASRTEKTAVKGEYAFHLVLLVKNLLGYQNLCKLLTRSYTEGFYYKPRVDKELLRQYNEGLIALSACLHGEVAYDFSIGQRDAAERAATEYKAIFNNRRFYLEIQHHGIEEQERVNKEIIELGRRLDIPLVATNDCHYLRKEDARVHDVLLCIQTGTTVNAPQRMRFSTEEFYVKSPDEMIEAFKDTPEAIANTIEIAERCNFEFTLGKNFLPEYPLPAGETLDSLIDAKARAGLEKRLDAMRKQGADVESIKWQYYDRLEKELKVIKGMGFPGYFLIVTDFIDYARGRDIPVGPGRGSAAGSLVAYSLGITNLDPIRYNLLFERFLNPDRISLPDIDIDFCFEKRDEVIRYVTEKYGADNVTQIITFGQMKARAVIRDVGRALDMPYGEVDKIAKLIPNQLNITIEKALTEEPRLKKLTEENPKVRELIDAAIKLEGLPRHASTHAAGVVISNKPLVDYLPLYKGQKENIVTTQYAMKDVEKIGLVKFDFLGIKTLTLIDRATSWIKKNRAADVDIEKIPLDDRGTYKLISSANTNGIFQLESSGMKELLKKLKPETFEELMAAVALFRPGPLQSGMVDDFIKRKHGLIPMRYEIPELKVILENTYGVMVYQEQVMEIAKVLAGFTPGEADVLRKEMGKKVPETMLEQRQRFIDGAKRKKIPEKKAEKIFELMANFAGYGFNKSHSAAYALIAYQTAYLKTHYPVEFMAALLSANMDDTDKVIKYIGECRDMGIEILPPDINESSWDFTVKGTSVRFGLAAIKNVGSAAIECILSSRESGPFTALEDFLARIDSRKVNKKVIESLIKSGSFDSTSKTRRELLSSLEASMEMAQGMQREKAAGQTSLFGSFAAFAKEPPPSSFIHGAGAGVKELDEKELLSFEKETLGFYITSHPLYSYEKELSLYATDTTESVREKKTGEETAIAGIVTQKRETITKKGARMAFLRLEDLKGGVEVIVFSDLYGKNLDIINSDSPLLVSGRVERDSASVERERIDGVPEVSEECRIVATDIMLLEDAKSKKTKKVHILLPTASVGQETFDSIKALLKKYPGGSPVFLHLVYPEDREVVVSLPDELKIDPGADILSLVKEISPGADVRFT